MATNHNEYRSSVIREKMLLHRFLGEIYTSFWNNEDYSIEVLFAEVDNAGYDVVLIRKDQPVFIQLKAISMGSKTKTFNINKRLADKKNGCVVLLEDTRDGLLYQYFKAENLNEYKTAKHAKPNSRGIKGEREGIVKVSKNKFEECSIEKLIKKMFNDE